MSYQQAMQAGDYGGAIATLDTLLQIDPNQPKLWYTKAIALLSLKQPTAAIVAIEQALRLNPNMAIAHRLLAKAYRQTGDTSAAIMAYKQATRLYVKTQDKTNAQACLAEIESLRPNAEPLISSKGFLDDAIAAAQQGNYRKALQDLNWLLQLDPHNVEALVQRSFAHAQCHNADASIKDIAKAMELAGQAPTIQLKRGEIYLLLGHIESAIADFSALLENKAIDPAPIYYLRGRAFQDIHSLEQAFKDFSEALEKQPNNANYHQARGQICEDQGHLKESLTDYRQAQRLYLTQGNLAAHQQLQHTIHSVATQLRTLQEQQQRIIRIPIKRFSGGTPVVEVMFNDSCPFDMVLDTGASKTFLTQMMGRLLNITPIKIGRFCMADGRIVESPIGIVNSIALGSARVERLRVGISPTGNEGLLGQNFLGRYNMHILQNTIELHPRHPQSEQHNA
ncbi:MAG: tetratricopeptide repeat protein [Cyanobacteria bacterium J06633_23]